MRKISSLFAIWAVFLTTLPTFANTRLQDDLITIGKPGSTANKRIKLGTQEIRSNTATSKLEYTHDGVTYKPVGSGSGAGGSSGGINLLANDSFEDPITTGWQNTGGTLTQEAYEFGTETDAKFARFVATAAGQYFESTLVTVPNNFTGGCQADFKKVNVSADDLFKIEILDSSSNVLSTGTVKKLTQQRFPTISTPCPTPGSQFRIRVTSLAAGTFEGDFGYLGSNQNLVSVAQAKLLGTIKWAATSGCLWQTTSTTFTNLPLNNSCPNPVTSGSVVAPSTKIPAVVIGNVLPGEYVFVQRGSFSSAGAIAVRSYLRFTDGANFDSIVAPGANSPGYETSSGTIISRFSYGSTLSNLTFQSQLRSESASTTVSINAQAADYEIAVYYYPSSTETAVNTDQSSWFIDASMGGTGNPAFTTAAVNSYTEILDAGLDLVINNGSSPAQIACASGTDSTGLTCSSSESIGITFSNLESGVFEVCADHAVGIGGGNVTTQLIETTPTSSAIVQEGKTRISTYASSSSEFPIKLCGNFTFSDAKRRTVRLMFEKSSTTSQYILADRNASYGQRDIHWTVRPLLSAYNRPILTSDQVTTPGAVNPEVFGVAWGQGGVIGANCTSGNCLVNSSSNKVTAFNFVSSGTFSLVTNKTWSELYCTGNAVQSGTGPVIVGNSPMYCTNCTSITVSTVNPSGSSLPSTGTLNCTGH